MNDTEGALQILIEARSILSRGWIQGSAYNYERTAFCAGGAIDRAFQNQGYTNDREGREIFQLAERAVLQVACRSWSLPFCNIPMWNDMPGRTKAEVLRTFDEAITELTKEIEPPKIKKVVIPAPAEQVYAPSIVDRVRELIGV